MSNRTISPRRRELLSLSARDRSPQHVSDPHANTVLSRIRDSTPSHEEPRQIDVPLAAQLSSSETLVAAAAPLLAVLIVWGAQRRARETHSAAKRRLHRFGGEKSTPSTRSVSRAPRSSSRRASRPASPAGCLKLSDEQIDALVSLFREFDYNNSGFVDAHELLAVGRAHKGSGVWDAEANRKVRALHSFTIHKEAVR